MSWTDQEATVSAINAIDRCASIDDVVSSLTCFVERFGFETITIAQLVSPARAGQSQFSISNWPEDYVKDRKSRNVFVHDPIIKQAIRTKAPFSWEDVYRKSDKFGRDIIDEARQFTRKNGLLIPIHLYDQTPGCVSVGADKIDITKQQISWIDVVCMQAYSKILGFLGPQPFEIHAELTPREIDVVHYGAAGKTNWEISEILELSEHTVRDYFRTTAKKLNTVSRTHTIAVAISNGLVVT